MEGKVKMIRQKDAKDCGVACLASIASYYGKELQVHKVREMAGTTSEGNSMYSLIRAAEKLGFRSGGWQADDPEEMRNQMVFPVIAHTITPEGFGHYVVIWNMKEYTFLIGDPADGCLREMDINEFFGFWNGYIISLIPGENFQKEKGKDTKRDLFRTVLKENRNPILKILTVSIMVYAAGILGAFYYQFFIDHLIPSGSTAEVWILGSSVLFAYLVQACLGIFRQKALIRMSRKIDDRLILGSFRHIMHLPMNFFDTRKKGEVLTRLQDSFKVHEILCSTVIGAILDVMMGAVGAILLLGINPYLFLICLAVSVASLSCSVLVKDRLKVMNEKLLQKNGEFSSAIIEQISGEEVVKTCSYEEESCRRIREKYNYVVDYTEKTAVLNGFQNILGEFFSSSAGIVVLMTGFSFIMKDSISIGELVMFNSLISYFLNPVCSLAAMIPKVQEAFTAADRLCELLDMETEKTDIHSDENISLGDLSVQGLCFEYGDECVLDGIDLELKRGESIAVVGESGCGKTTLVKVLMGLYPATKGKIHYNGTPIEQIPAGNLRKKISYVPQNSFLFGMTIRENLSMGQTVTDQDIEEACKAVGMHEKIRSMPLGYMTVLEEGGSNLSGGERQRLAIARALLKKDAEMYVLDEATSSLDSRTEEAISSVVFERLKGKSRIIIAHRLGTICQCDRIVVMNDKGQIVETGNHHSLLSKHGTYYMLWKRQTGNDPAQKSVA